MAWILVALVLLQLATSASAIEPYDCTEGSDTASAAIQVLDPKNDDGEDYYVARLGIADGEYTLMFKLPKDQIEYERVNSCGISPNDSMMYCLFDLSGRYWLARFDSSIDGDNAGIEYVAESPTWAAAGGFTMAGDYYLSSKTKMLTMPQPDVLAGKSTPDDTLPKLTKIPGKATTDMGCDINAVEMDLDGTGEKDWIVSIHGGKVVAVSEDGKNCAMTSSGDTLPTKSFGAAWSYQGQLYYACNDGNGVFQVKLSDGACSDSVADPQVNVVKVGVSEPTDKNDGMNCMKATPPPWTPDTTPEPVPDPVPSTSGPQESMPVDAADAMAQGAADATESFWVAGRPHEAGRPGPHLAAFAAAGVAATLVVGSAALLWQRRPATAAQGSRRALVATEEDEERVARLGVQPQTQHIAELE